MFACSRVLRTNTARGGDVRHRVAVAADGGWLFVLGIRALWAARRPGGIDLDTGGRTAAPGARTRRAGFGLGLTGGLLSPKVDLFYVAVIPQVVPHDIPILRGTLMFAGVDTAVAALYMPALAAAAGW